MSAKLSIEFQPADDDSVLRFRVICLDTSLLKHRAEFSLQARVVVHDSRGIDSTKTIWKDTIILSADGTEVDLPPDKIEAFSYSGKMIDIELHAQVKVDDGYIFDTTVSTDVEMKIGLKPERINTAKHIVEPKDSFNLVKNMGAIPYRNRLNVVILLLIGLIVVAVNTILGVHDQFVPESATYVYSHYDSDGDGNSPLMNSLMGSGALGAFIWFLLRGQLRKYLKFNFKEVPVVAGRGGTFELKDLVTGKARVPLEQVTVRVVACNMEKGQYKRGSGTNERTVSFSEPVNGVILFERIFPVIPAARQIEDSFVNCRYSFDDMMDELFPPLTISSSHGLTTYWEVQLIHPTFVDHELVGPSLGIPYKEFLTVGSTPTEDNQPEPEKKLFSDV